MTNKSGVKPRHYKWCISSYGDTCSTTRFFGWWDVSQWECGTSQREVMYIYVYIARFVQKSCVKCSTWVGSFNKSEKLSCCGYICFGALTHLFRPNNKISCYLVFGYLVVIFCYLVWRGVLVHRNICNHNKIVSLIYMYIYIHIYRSNLCRSVWKNHKSHRDDRPLIRKEILLNME